MLLTMYVTSVLFLVLAGNFALTMASIGVIRSYSSRPFLCTLAMTYNIFVSCPLKYRLTMRARGYYIFIRLDFRSIKEHR